MSNQKINFELGNHREKEVIFILFEKSSDLILRVKKLAGSRWSQSKKMWYVPDNETYRLKFKLPQKKEGKAILSKISIINQPYLQRFIETLQLKGYSINTLKTYRNEFAQLLFLLKDKNVFDCDETTIRNTPLAKAKSC